MREENDDNNGPFEANQSLQFIGPIEKIPMAVKK